MALPPNPPTEPADRLAWRDVLSIAIVGAALGVGFNVLLLQAEPSRGLSWVKRERAVVQLGLDPGAASVTPAGSAGAAEAPKARADAQAADPAPVEASPTARGATPPGAAPGAVGSPSRAAMAPGSRRDGANPAGAAPASSDPAASTPASPSPPTQAPAVDVPVIPDSRDPIEAGLEVVRRLHAADAAVFLDARTAAEYAEGHIAGAINLPFDDVFRNPALAQSVDAKGRAVVTYCGGGGCELSRSLAFSLLDAGKRRVVVFKEGLPAWQEAGLPVHMGTQP